MEEARKIEKRLRIIPLLLLAMALVFVSLTPLMPARAAIEIEPAYQEKLRACSVLTQPSANDTLIYQGAADTNYDDVYFQTNPLASHLSSILIDFDLSALPSGITIISASLELYYYNYVVTDPVGRTLTIYRQRRTDWVETEATWNIYKTGSNWGTAGALNTTTDIDTSLTSTATVPAAYGWIDWDIGELAQDAVDDRSEILRMKIADLGGGAQSSWTAFHSSEYAADTNLRPKVVVTYCTTDNAKVIQPTTADAQINKGANDTNYGGLTYMSPFDHATSTRRCLLEFDVSSISIPSGRGISHVSLQVYLFDYYSCSAEAEIQCRRVTEDWWEGNVTWNNQPTTTTDLMATQRNTAGEPDGYGWLSIDVTDLAKDARDNRSDELSVMLKFTTESGPTTEPGFYSKEYATSFFRPRLIVHYSELPCDIPYEKYASNPVLTETEPYEDRGLRYPTIYTENGVHYVFYTVCGNESTDWVAAMANTTDFINYTKQGVMIEHGNASSWDEACAQVEDIFKIGSTYYAIYTGIAAGEIWTAPFKTGIATASSLSGPWTKYGSNPIFLGSGGTNWDADWAIITDVIDGPAGCGYNYMGFYCGTYPAGKTKVGIAYSDDLYTWVRYANNPIMAKESHELGNGIDFLENPKLFEYEDEWYMGMVPVSTHTDSPLKELWLHTACDGNLTQWILDRILLYPGTGTDWDSCWIDIGSFYVADSGRVQFLYSGGYNAGCSQTDYKVHLDRSIGLVTLALEIEITTNAATLIKAYSATLWGEVTGTASTDYWGFVWGDDCASTPATLAQGTWDNFYSYDETKAYGETFSYGINSLLPNTTYYFMAGGNETEGDVDWGVCVSFETASGLKLMVGIGPDFYF